MKTPAALALILLASALRAQAPVPVPLARGNTPGEPHHHLKIENEYVRAYYVEVPPHGETQLHQHDNDYMFVTLGDSDVTNAVLGKPEVHLQLKDGEVRFTRGGFAHVARNNSDAPFRNVTIEFLHPQGEVHNRCAMVVAGAPQENCEETNEIIPGVAEEPSDYAVPGHPIGTNRRLLFETDEAFVQEWTMSVAASASWDRQVYSLVVGVGPAPIEVQSGKKKARLAPGQMLWLEGGPKAQFQKASSSDTRRAHFLVVSFKGGASSK